MLGQGDNLEGLIGPHLGGNAHNRFPSAGPISRDIAEVCRRVKRASHQRNLAPDQLFVRCRSALFALRPSGC
jgi:hypothetical protein